MTLDELAEVTGEDIPTLTHYLELGVIESDGDFGPADLERVRLVQVLRRRGIDPSAVGAALQKELDAFERYLTHLYPDGGYPSVTVEEAAARAGIDVDLLMRVREAGGLGGPNDRLSEADVDAMRAITIALQAGFPEEALLQLVRVYSDSLNRVAEAEARLFHFYVHERLKAEGLRDRALEAATVQSVDQVIGLVEPAILFFHRRGLDRAVRDDLALHLAEDAGLVPPDDETGRLFAAVAFIDLARFTALTEAMGDASAAQVLNRFSDLVRRCAVAHDGRIVKQIGDAFMLVFGDPRSAVDFALDIREAALREPQFLGTRQGLHWGPVLYREGDYYGATVNLAARIVAESAADQVLVSRQLREVLTDGESIVFAAAGLRSVKHVSEPVEVFDARRPGDDPATTRVLDPVCGMTVDPAAPAARLQVDGRDLVFCSHACLQRFVAAPERYT